MNLEDATQAKMVVWFKNNYQMNRKGFIFSVPNGGSRNVVEAKKLKETGLTAGVSDLIVLFPDKTIFIEVKTLTGTQSESQKKFEYNVKNLGYNYFIVKTLIEFQELCTSQHPAD